MNNLGRARLALPAAVLSAVLLTACGSGADTAGGAGGSSGGHSGSHRSSTAAQADDADIAYLAGMTPHHEQAVEMSDIVLAANPPAEVAAIARQIKAAQAPEIEQMNEMLKAVGAGSGEHGGHDSHGGMMSDADMEALRAATGTDAARLYLEGMIRHHEGAIEASDAQLTDGKYKPALELARKIKAVQQAEITKMRELLAGL